MDKVIVTIDDYKNFEELKLIEEFKSKEDVYKILDILDGYETIIFINTFEIYKSLKNKFNSDEVLYETTKYAQLFFQSFIEESLITNNTENDIIEDMENFRGRLYNKTFIYANIKEINEEHNSDKILEEFNLFKFIKTPERINSENFFSYIRKKEEDFDFLKLVLY